MKNAYNLWVQAFDNHYIYEPPCRWCRYFKKVGGDIFNVYCIGQMMLTYKCFDLSSKYTIDYFKAIMQAKEDEPYGWEE